ncbi:hypothetical protein GCM10010466_20100 [Planomonospora alba]|uniref:Uncharacterized protein n=1 Tax=Planomonospora alba TaxID=161354 RepID=A0ABP6MXM0_9ACTN
MLRLHDTSSGRAERVVPEGARALRIGTRGPAARPARLGDLRPHLLADLVRRVCERHRLRVVLHRAADDDAFHADTLTLNLRPAEHSSPGALPEVPEGTVLLDAAGGPAGPRAVRTGPVLGGDASAAGGAGATLGDVAARGLDPLAVRLALLGHRYREPADLSWDALRAADRTLRRMRSRVAEWSEHPSSPMPVDRVARIEAALDDDLDTPSALRLAEELEQDEALAPGSRFEAFVHLDTVLALDLPADIGRPPGEPR